MPAHDQPASICVTKVVWVVVVVIRMSRVVQKIVCVFCLKKTRGQHTDQLVDGRTNPSIEMRGRIQKLIFLS